MKVENLSNLARWNWAVAQRLNFTLYLTLNFVTQTLQNLNLPKFSTMCKLSNLSKQLSVF